MDTHSVKAREIYDLLNKNMGYEPAFSEIQTFLKQEIEFCRQPEIELGGYLDNLLTTKSQEMKAYEQYKASIHRKTNKKSTDLFNTFVEAFRDDLTNII